MPKTQKNIGETHKQRLKMKEKFANYVPGRISLQVLGTGAEGAPKSLYVFSDQSRYLFNCGEGTQRLAHEHKMKLSKLEHIFITQNSWENIGGLPGTALTMQDVGVPQITLHGPKSLEEIFNATKHFVILRDLKVKMAECNERNTYTDNVMTVHYVPIKRTPIVQVDEDDGFESKATQVGNSPPLQRPASPNQSKKTRKDTKSQNSTPSSSFKDIQLVECFSNEHKGRSPARLVTHSERKTSLSPTKYEQESKLEVMKVHKKLGVCVNYICKLQPRPGALSLEKCVRFGIPTGPLLGKLKMGEDVILPSGTIVRSVDVCEPDDPGPVFLVVDCPSEEYLEEFVEHPAFKKHQCNSQTKHQDLAYLVVHFTPQHILEDPRYCAWVDSFSPSTQHLVLNNFNTCMGSIAVHRVQHKLNLLNEKIFPLLGDTGTKCDMDENAIKRLKPDRDIVDTVIKRSPNVLEKALQAYSTIPKVFTYANTICNFHLRPRLGLDRASELKLNPNEYIEEPYTESGFKETLEKLQAKIMEQTRKMRINPFPKLLFLGTGSSIPNKTRNTSGILFQCSPSTNIILDCGEGTYGQLVRFFGPDKVDKVLANIKAIFISHLHADHHIGLIGLLQGRSRAIKKLKCNNTHPVLLLAPKQISTWLNFYDTCYEDISSEYEIIPNSDLLFREHTLYEGTQVRLNTVLDMFDISTVFVRHCANAFGIAFRHKAGYKVCYSGDTMPCEDLIHLGMHSDLLIHEATMEDELEEEAVLKMHSTTSQAIEIGNNMFAKYILLTHFSQRYAKLPRFNDNFTSNVGIAFDNMQVSLDELPLLPLLNPALQMIFAEHYEELETKAMKRQLKIERREEFLKASQ